MIVAAKVNHHRQVHLPHRVRAIVRKGKGNIGSDCDEDVVFNIN